MEIDAPGLGRDMEGPCVRPRFIGLMISCEIDGYESKPSSKGRSRKQGRSRIVQAAENGENSIRRPTDYSVRHAPDNLIKEEPSTGESAVETSSSIGGNRGGGLLRL